MAPKKSQCHCC